MLSYSMLLSKFVAMATFRDYFDSVLMLTIAANTIIATASAMFRELATATAAAANTCIDWVFDLPENTECLRG
jgi:hypothetical protein